MENSDDEESVQQNDSKIRLSLNIGKISILNLITFGLQMAAIVLSFAFVLFNLIFSQASDTKLLSFFGKMIPQGVFDSPQDGFMIFGVLFAVLGIISLVLMTSIFYTRGKNKRSLYYANMAVLVVLCITGAYYLFGFHLVPADLGGFLEDMISAAESLGINIFGGIKYPWFEEFIAIFSGLSFMLMFRKKAKDYILLGKED